jgi:hypothetical protein
VINRKAKICVLPLLLEREADEAHAVLEDHAVITGLGQYHLLLSAGQHDETVTCDSVAALAPERERESSLKLRCCTAMTRYVPLLSAFCATWAEASMYPSQR